MFPALTIVTCGGYFRVPPVNAGLMRVASTWNCRSRMVSG